MLASRVQLRVPGKLLVAGEYAVLEPHQPSVVVAVDRYMKATIELAEENRLSLPDWDLLEVPFQDLHDRIRFSVPDARLAYVGAGLAVALAHLRDQFLLPFPFHLTLTSDLDDESGRKYGLGSSAAVVVATVAAVLALLGDEEALDLDRVFKLSAIAHFRAQGSGSGADVAASTYGGWLSYTSFQPDWLRDRLKREEPLYKLVEEPWPFFSVERLVPSREVCLCVGWTGEPASTGALIERVRALRDRSPESYGNFLSESREAVEALVAGLRAGERKAVLSAIARNRRALTVLGAQSGVAIETPALAALNHWAEVCGGAGKPSGAGGGDCGVALVFGEDRAESLRSAWERAGLTPLRLGVADEGVAVICAE